MELKRLNGKLTRAALAPLLLALIACHPDRSGSPAGNGTAARTYVLVTQQRPESPQKFLSHLQGFYELCAATARQKNIIPKPFPTLPGDFVNLRTTYANDGQRSVVSEVSYGIDFVGHQTNPTCEMRIASQQNTTVMAKATAQTTHVDEDGTVHMLATQPYFYEPVMPMLMKGFKVPKTIHGVPLKCSADGICIVDPALVLIHFGIDPIQAAARIDDVATYGTAVIVEPVSLAVGKPVDPALFLTGKAK